MSDTLSPAARLQAQRYRDLMASIRDIGPSRAPNELGSLGPGQTAGITSGPGNQGSANTANLQGHAGTSAGFLGLPRQIKQGAWGAKPQ